MSDPCESWQEESRMEVRGLALIRKTGRTPCRSDALMSGLRMLGIGGAAGSATYFIGACLGVSLG